MTDEKINVLIVEDTMTQALMLQHLLEQHNYKTTIARSPLKALEVLKEMKPDLILSDVSMPDMDGYELCRRLKADAATKDIPFVLLSSFNDPRDIVNIVNSRADTFMLKRFDEKYFLGRLDDLLASRKLRNGSKQTAAYVFQGSTNDIEGDTVQLTEMVLSAFATVCHLLPLVHED
jgi:response regulator RpfG family c-di-GMP phosphodiesterase